MQPSKRYRGCGCCAVVDLNEIGRLVTVVVPLSIGNQGEVPRYAGLLQISGFQFGETGGALGTTNLKSRENSNPYSNPATDGLQLSPKQLSPKQIPISPFLAST